MGELDRFTREYSWRLGRLTGAQLQAALDRFDLGELQHAEPIVDGVSGQNVSIRTTRGEWVMRASPWHSGQFEKERFFARLICERTGLVAPWPYRVEPSDEILGYGYAIMPRLEGIQGRADTPEERLARARALGEALAELHGIQWEHCGEYQHPADTIVAQKRPFAQWKLATLQEWIERAQGHSDATSPADVQWAERIVEENQSGLAEPFTPTYVHHDFREANTVAEPDAAGFRISGVFDLTEGYIGHPEEDLVRAVWEYAKDGEPGCSRAYVEAYRTRAGLAANAGARFAIFMLHDCLVLWEYGQRMGNFPAGVDFRSFAEHFVTLDVI